MHDNHNGFYTYPDVIVVCGNEEYLDKKFDTLLNPTVLFEVLSTATEDYDRGTQFKLYRSLPSLQNYVLVSSTEFAAEVYTRSDDQWILSTAKDKNDYIHISAINTILPYLISMDKLSTLLQNNKPLNDPFVLYFFVQPLNV